MLKTNILVKLLKQNACMISIKIKKYIKSLQIKKYRQQHQAFLVEGWKSVDELLKSDFDVEHLFISEKFSHLCNGDVVDEKDINEVSSLHNNKEAIAVVKIPSEINSIDENQPIFIFEGIQDPGNLGTIIRTADWLGLPNIVCSSNSVDFYNPKVITSTKGSFLRVIPKYADVLDFLNQHENKDVFLADLDGNDYKKTDYANNSIIIFGGESKGISDEIRNLNHQKVSIIKRGEAESLNVAMSFGIIAAKL